MKGVIMVSSFLLLRKSCVIACGLILIALQTIVAQPPVPISGFPQANDRIRSFSQDGTNMYICGDFTAIGTPSNPLLYTNLAKCTITNSLPNPNIPAPQGIVEAIIPDGVGGFFVGGSFTSITPAPTRSRLFHLLANGTVDPAWNAGVINNEVRTLAFDGTNLYVGGLFTSIGGQTRNRIAKLAGSTGAVDLMWDANLTTSTRVESIVLNGGDVYFGGQFTAVNGQARNNIARVDATTGALDMTWNPGADNIVETLALDGGFLYLGGAFGNVASTPRASIARVNAATGALDMTWNPGADATVYAIMPDAAGIYVGGNFGITGVQVRKRIARLSASGTGSADSWDPGLDPVSNLITRIFDIRVSGGNVYVGGLFERIGGQSVMNAAKLDPVTGNADITWQPNRVSQVQAIGLDGAGNMLLGGGAETNSVGGYYFNGVARVIKATKALDLAWRPFISGTSTPVIRSVLVNGTDVFVGGFFNRVNNTLINNLAKINASTALLDAAWNSLGANSDVYCMVTDGANLFLGGNFFNIGGVGRGRVAKMTLANPGTVDGTWNPNASNIIHTMQYDGIGNLYVGGDFTFTIGGQSRNRIAKLSTSGAGAADPIWNPNASSTVYSLLLSGTDVFAGGTFTTIGGQSRSRIAKLSASGTGAADPAWNVNSGGTVFALYQNGPDLYVGGNFSVFASQPRSRLAKVSAVTGTLDMTWNPGANNDVNEFAYDVANQWLYTGGLFTLLNGGAISNRSLTVLPITVTPATTYYYEAGDPNLPGSWGTQAGAGIGTPATNFITTGDIFIVESGTTTVAPTANISLGSGVTLQVQGGLNMDNFAVTGAGNFLLNAGATLGTANTDGINGVSVGTGTIQATGTITYSPAANYIFSTPAGPDRDTRFEAVATKPAITTMNKLKSFGAGSRRLTSAITVNDTCLLNARFITHSSLGSSLTVNGAATLNNVQFWHNGSLIIGATGSFAVNGSSAELALMGPLSGGGPGMGSVSSLGTNNVTYIGNPLLSFNAGYSSISNNAFFPATLNARVHIGSGTTLILNDSKTVTGTINIDGVLDCGVGPGFTHDFSALTTFIGATGRIYLSGQNLTLNGLTNSAGGQIRGDVASNLTLQGTVSGSLTFEVGNQVLNNLTLNYVGTATLASPLTVQNILTVTSGRLVTTNLNPFSLTNTSVNALIGGSSTAYIDGAFVRELAPNLNSDGTHYFYPLGVGGSYRPITLRDVRTGASATSFRCTGFGTGAMTSSAPLASVQSPNWECTQLNGSYISSTIEIDATGVSGGYGVGMSSAQAGVYNSILATTGGATRRSTPQAANSFSIGVPRYFALGIVGPVITNISPLEIETDGIVTITGSYLDGVSAIAFGGYAGTLLSVSSNTLTARVGEGGSGYVTLISNVGVTQSAQQVTYTALPIITSFSPTVGTTNSTITIFGRRFGSVQSVFFGGVPALASQVISSSEIRSIVSPSGASGLVSMTSPYGTTTSSQQFTFDRIPFITGFSPEFVRPLDTVRILGSHFGSTSRILIGTTEFLRFSVVSPTELRLVADVPFTSGPVQVENAVGTAATTSILSYAPVPTITTVTPVIAATEQTITIRGAGFVGLPRVSITQDGAITTAASVSVISLAELRVAFTTATVGFLTVQTYGGAATTASVVTILAKPVIHAVQPLQIMAQERVTVTGANFTNIQSVLLGGVAVSFNAISPTQLSILAPSSPVGLIGAVTVRTLGGTTTSSQIVRVLAPPNISSLQPNIIQTGSTLNIFGTNFRNVLAVRIAGATAQFTVDASANRITAIVPVSSTLGNVRVIVQTQDGTADADAILVLPPIPTPVITGFSPNPVREGEILTIFGANFPVGTTVTVGLGSLTSASVQVTSSSQLAFILPAQTLGVQQSSTQVFISLSSQFGTTTAQIQATVSANAIPAFTDFSPKRGTSTASVTLRGENFGVEPRGRVMAVRIGGVNVSEYRIKSTSEIVLVPGNVRTGRVEIEMPFGILTSREDFELDTTKISYIPLVTLKDSLALLAIYRATNGNNWTRRDNWLRADVPITSWFGVRIVSGRVVEVRLPNNNLRGGLAAAVQDLDSLSVLDLSNNALSGELGTLFCPLVHLQELNLSGNTFTGTLPRCLERMQNLATLNLSDNQLSDTLPQSWSNLTNLMFVNLSNNRLHGSLPRAWGVESSVALASKQSQSGIQALTGLQRLNLSNNQLSGVVPASWAGLRGMRELRLSNNQLSGDVPQEFSRMTSLQTLDLRNNAFMGIPDFTRLERLDSLLVGGNRIGIASLANNTTSRVALVSGFRYTPQQLSFGSTQATTAVLDESVTLRVEIPPSLQHGENRTEWLQNGVTVRATSTEISLTTASFIIAAAQENSAGEYRCILSNTRLPGLWVTSSPILLRTTQNTVSSLLSPPILVSPAQNETDVSTVATFSWLSVANAVRYECEISSTSTFSAFLRMTTSLTIATMASPLQYLQAYQWRVRAVNSRGAGDWSDVRTFTTIAPNAELAVSRLDFGSIARFDTSSSVLTVRNASATKIVVEGVTTESSITGDFSLSTIANISLTENQEARIAAFFHPQQIGVRVASIRVQYRVEARNGQLSDLKSINVLQRLEGTGLGLKVIAPIFDTVLVGQTRVASALVVNRGTATALLNDVVISSDNDTYNFASDIDRKGISIGVGDTTSVLVKCTAKTVPLGRISLLGGSVRYDAIFEETTSRREQASTLLTAFSRQRTANDPIARVAVRTSTKNLSPGNRFMLYVMLDSANIPALIANGATRFSATLRYNRNVLTLAPEEKGAWKIRNTSATNPFERITIVPTAWDGRSAILAQVQCFAVAGDTEVSVIEIEQIQWQGASLEEFRKDTLRLNICTAGGKRLVTSAKATALSVIAPNPAKDAITLNYTVREDGFVRLELIDMHGKVVQILVSEEQTAGEYSLNAALENLPSGAYTLRLQSGDSIKVREVKIVR